MMRLGGDAESGFVDVAANALALIMLMVVIVLVVASVPAMRGEVRADARPYLAFPVEIDPATQPLNSYWIVLAEGAAPVDLSAAASAFADGQTRVRTAAGSFDFINPRSNYRDLSDYTVNFAPDAATLSEIARPLDAPADRAALVAEIAAAFEAGFEVPTFFATSQGYDAFAALYLDLRDADLPLRWVMVPDGQAIGFRRTPEQFETRMATWR